MRSRSAEGAAPNLKAPACAWIQLEALAAGAFLLRSWRRLGLSRHRRVAGRTGIVGCAGLFERLRGSLCLIRERALTLEDLLDLTGVAFGSLRSATVGVDLLGFVGEFAEVHDASTLRQSLDW